MTPYQRGNRDALINAATLLDQEADRYDEEARKILGGRGYKSHIPVHYGSWARAEGQALVLRWARDLLVSLSDQYPEDPESMEEP